MFCWGPNVADLEGRENLRHWLLASEVSPLLKAPDDPYVYHAPVGSFEPNPFGLHDVHGNVSEWCLDWDPEGQPERTKSFRGGNWSLSPMHARSAFRLFAPPSSAEQSRGLRLARSLRPAR